MGGVPLYYIQTPKTQHIKRSILYAFESGCTYDKKQSFYPFLQEYPLFAIGEERPPLNSPLFQWRVKMKRTETESDIFKASPPLVFSPPYFVYSPIVKL
jgi:hypothetical protein